MIRAALVPALLATVLAPMTASSAVVAGSATYLARIATPPGSTFEATLLDVSRADAPAVELGRFAKADAGNPPYPFVIAYDPAAIAPQMRLSVRATLRWPDGRLAFTSDRVHPVLTQGAGDRVEIVMAQAGGAEPAAPAAEPPTLVGPVWALVEIAGAPPPEGVRAELSFDGDGRISGTGGCNRLGAGYIARPDGAFLAGLGMSTMMACPEPAMKTEQAVFDALDRARAWSIDGDRLTLADAAGAPLAVLRTGP
jgi:putative lipoprotein